MHEIIHSPFGQFTFWTVGLVRRFCPLACILLPPQPSFSYSYFSLPVLTNVPIPLVRSFFPFREPCARPTTPLRPCTRPRRGCNPYARGKSIRAATAPSPWICALEASSNARMSGETTGVTSLSFGSSLMLPRVGSGGNSRKTSKTRLIMSGVDDWWFGGMIELGLKGARTDSDSDTASNNSVESLLVLVSRVDSSEIRECKTRFWVQFVCRFAFFLQEVTEKRWQLLPCCYVRIATHYQQNINTSLWHSNFPCINLPMNYSLSEEIWWMLYDL